MFVGLDNAAELKAIDPRKHDIQDDQVRLVPLKEVRQLDAPAHDLVGTIVPQLLSHVEAVRRMEEHPDGVGGVPPE